MRHGRARRLLFGSAGGIAGTIYGTIVVMATVAAGSHGEDTDAAQLAVLVAVTVLVLWVAHVYSHALAESIRGERRLDRAELTSVARRELAIPAAALVPVTVLVLAAAAVLAEQTAIWLALGAGVVTLAAEGARYASAEHLGRARALVSVLLNVCLGLVIVVLEVLVTH